jgi:hypothetical protein
MRLGYLAILIGANLAIWGCGDDAPAKSEPEQKCESFAGTWCQRSIGCLVTLGKVAEAQRVASQDTCRDVGIAALQCKKVASVGVTYPQCIADIGAMECATWDVPEDKYSTIQPPETCRGIFVFSP